MHDVPVRRRWPIVLGIALLAGSVGLGLAYLSVTSTVGAEVAPSARASSSQPSSPNGVRRPALPGLPGVVPVALRADTAGGEEVELIPGRPGYDPGAITELIPLEQLFAQEPRNDDWAKKIEEALPGIALRDVERLVPGLEIVGIVCKTTSCRLEWRAPKESIQRARAVMRFLVPAAVAETRPPYHYVALAGGRWLYRDVPAGDPGKTLAVAEQARERILARMRRRNPSFPGPAGIPPESWPRQ